jgi:hypothetical protein
VRYGINRLIDSRNYFELIQRGFIISKNNNYSGGTARIARTTTAMNASGL